MTMIREHQVDCPKCQGRTAYTLYGAVNVGVDPDLHAGVLDCSLFTQPCENCGHPLRNGGYPLMYVNPGAALLIQVLPHEPGPLSPSRRAVLERAFDRKKLGGMRSYRLRLVPDFAALAERVRVLEADLDDRVIELLKWRHLREPALRDRVDPAAPPRLTFTGFDFDTDDRRLCFAGPARDDGLAFEVGRDAYDALLADIDALLPWPEPAGGELLRIDQAYVEALRARTEPLREPEPPAPPPEPPQTEEPAPTAEPTGSDGATRPSRRPWWRFW